MKRDRVARIRRNRNRDKPNVANAAVRGIEIDPTCSWQIDLRPRMSRPRAVSLVGFCKSLTGSAR